MDSIESYLRKLIVASVGAADLGCEKLGKLLDECVARGEVTVENRLPSHLALSQRTPFLATLLRPRELT